MPISPRFRIAGDNIIHDTIDNEVILLNIETGTYYQLKQNGMVVWNALVQTVPLAEIQAQFATRYPNEQDAIATGLARFAHDLEQEALLVPLEDATNGQAPLFVLPSDAGATFLAPMLLKYTDMQSLLLLDPIHDVESAGWPVAKRDGKAP